MTGRETPPPDAVLHLLDEAGIAEDPALVRAVESIGTLKAGPAPEVGAELAQMMADGGKAPAGRRNKRRITFIGGALAVSMGVGMSGVAAGTALGDGLHEAVESIARFSIRDSVDRAHPLPDVLAGPEEGGRPGVVAPSVDAPVRSLAEAVPAPEPSAAGDSGRAAPAGPSPADTGVSVAHAAPRDSVGAVPPVPVGTASGAAPDATTVAGPPAAAPADRRVQPPAAPPAAVPPAAASPVAPAGSAPAPGHERRAMPVPGNPAPGNPAPGVPTPGSPVSGKGKADGQGHEVRQLKQARHRTTAGPDADARAQGGSSADVRAIPTPHGRVWLLAPAGGPGHVPSEPVSGDPEPLVLGEPGAGEATSVPEPAPGPGDAAGGAVSGVPQPVPTPGSAAGPAEEPTASASGQPGGEQPDADASATEQPVPGKRASDPAPE